MCRAVSRIVLYYIMFFLELLNSQKKKVHPVKNKNGRILQKRRLQMS